MRVRAPGYAHSYDLKKEWDESTVAWLRRRAVGGGGMVGAYLDEWNRTYYFGGSRDAAPAMCLPYDDIRPGMRRK